jgi:hypothetical protein
MQMWYALEGKDFLDWNNTLQALTAPCDSPIMVLKA